MKRSFKLLISLLVRGWDIIVNQGLSFMGRQRPPICVVLYYHSVPARQRQRFSHQMDLLLQAARPIPTVPPDNLEPGRHYAAVTFDDGFVSVLENAAPELKSRQIPWTVFVPSGCLGQSPAWLRHVPAEVRQDRVMTGEELRALSNDPLVCIGSHTVAHAHLVEAGQSRSILELSKSKADLENILNHPVHLFSYPFGARNSALDQQARELGYQRLFTSDPTPAFQTHDEFVTGRVNVDPSISPVEFRLKLLGAYRWLTWIGSNRSAASSR